SPRLGRGGSPYARHGVGMRAVLGWPVLAVLRSAGAIRPQAMAGDTYFLAPTPGRARPGPARRPGHPHRESRRRRLGRITRPGPIGPGVARPGRPRSLLGFLGPGHLCDGLLGGEHPRYIPLRSPKRTVLLAVAPGPLPRHLPEALAGSWGVRRHPHGAHRPA